MGEINSYLEDGDETNKSLSPAQTFSRLEIENNATTMDSLNKSLADADGVVDTGRDEDLAKVEIATLSVILLFALVGNGLMLSALRKILQYRPMSRMYFFMLNLSISDLLVAFGNILPQLCWDATGGIFLGPDILCRIVKFLQVFVLYLSTYVLTSMAVDRYLVVCHSNFSRNYYGGLKGPKILVLTSYIISFILASPQAVIFSMKDIEVLPGKVTQDCWVEFGDAISAKAYVTFFVIFAFALPLLIIVFSYGAICFKVVRYRLPNRVKSNVPHRINQKPSISDNACNCQEWNEPTSGELLSEQVSAQENALQQNLSKAKAKSLKLTLVVVLCFFACWSPFCATQLFVAYGSPTQSLGSIHVIMLLLASLNSCTNPWIYMAFSETLCNQLKIFVGLGLKGGLDEESIGEEAKPPKVNKLENEERIDLPKMNVNRKHDAQTSLGRNSPPSECDHKPETKSDFL